MHTNLISMMFEVIFLKERRIRNGHHDVAQHSEHPIGYRVTGAERDAVRYLVNRQGHRMIDDTPEAVGHHQDHKVGGVSYEVGGQYLG